VHSCAARSALEARGVLCERGVPRLIAIVLASFAACACELGAPLVLMDGGRRGRGPVDIHVDAFHAPSCEETCTAADTCDRARCEDGICVHTALSDGEVCADDGAQICVDRVCVVRGCGDGYRERGPAPPREACDDGDLDAGDFCDADCAPTPATLVDAPSIDAERDLAVAIDGLGRALVLIVRRAEPSVIEAHRFDARMRPIGAPIAIAVDDRPDAELAPTAAGLADGWAIALARSSGIEVGVMRDGAPGFEPFDASFTATSQAAIAPIESGFVVAITEESGGATDPLGGIRARMYGPNGEARGPSFAVADDRSGFESRAVLAARGDAWAIAWTRSGSGKGGLEVAGRLFSGRTPLGGELELASAPASWSPALAAFGEAFAFAWLEIDELGALALRARSIGEAGSERDLFSTRAGGRALVAPRALAIADALALVYVEGATDGALRVASVGEIPPELARVPELVSGRVLFAGGLDRLLCVWSDGSTVRAFVVPGA
jgi:cysteine-rich repeat protein